MTIEDAAELRLQQTHVARMETRPPNVEGVGAMTIRQLVINSLRMRPDRIIVGEICSAGGVGHVVGHEHRPRWIAHHASRQYPPRRPGPAGGHGGNGQCEYGHPFHSIADCLGRRSVRPDLALHRRNAPRHTYQEVVGMEQDIISFRISSYSKRLAWLNRGGSWVASGQRHST